MAGPGSWVSAPCAAAGCDVFCRSPVVVAEGFRDDRSGGLENELAERCGEGLGDGDTKCMQLPQEHAGGEGLPGPAAGKEPVAVWVCGSVHVGAVGREFQQHCVERAGNRGGWAAEVQRYLAIAAGHVRGGQADQPGDRLRVEQDEAGGYAGAERDLLLGEEPAQQRQAMVLADGRPGSAGARGISRRGMCLLLIAHARKACTRPGCRWVRCQESMSAWVVAGPGGRRDRQGTSGRQ